MIQETLSPTTHPKEIHIINVVWGEEYTKTLIQESLPSQLTLNNLPWLATYPGIVRYRIFTTLKDQRAIEESDIILQMRKYVTVDFINVEMLIQSDKYGSLTNIHAQAVRQANQNGAGMIFLSPDSIMTDGFFEELIQTVYCGKRIIMLAGPRVDKFPFLQALNNEKQKKQTPEETYHPKNIIPLAIKHLHRISKELIWNDNTLLDWPSHLYWKLSDTALLIRAFHLHPIFIWPSNRNIELDSTIDGGFLDAACPNKADWEILTNPRKAIAFEMSAPSIGKERKVLKCSISIITYWALSKTTKFHRSFIHNQIILSATEENYQNSEKILQSDRIIHSISKELNSPGLFICLTWTILLFKDDELKFKEKCNWLYLHLKNFIRKKCIKLRETLHAIN